ncbi:MAG: mycofactocin system glycosyltransferase [Myxococcales bacterium]|nr:mycofactocin system glycosyltransferase [Myxococcales bacterium]
MFSFARVTLIVLTLLSCNDHAQPAAEHAPSIRITVADKPPPVDAKLQAERDEYVAAAMAFTTSSHDDVLAKIHGAPMKEEWSAWEKTGPMTDARTKQFYKQTKNYIYDLGSWHLWTADKRESDLALVDDMRAAKPKNILDFGGGVGFNSLMLAQAGFDVTLADLDSATLQFASLRADRQHVTLKFWKSDVDAMPPDKKYDVILCLDVLEHLPEGELREIVDKLIKLKHPTTKVIIHAPFGRTDVHPMHLEATGETLRQVERLKTELPKE